MLFLLGVLFLFFKQKTAYEMRISDWSADVCSSDLFEGERFSGLDYRSPVEPAVNISNGVLLNSGCYPVAGQKNYWRLILDIERNDAEPADVRAFLRFKNDAITETLLYQLF